VSCGVRYFPASDGEKSKTTTPLSRNHYSFFKSSRKNLRAGNKPSSVVVRCAAGGNIRKTFTSVASQAGANPARVTCCVLCLQIWVTKSDQKRHFTRRVYLILFVRNSRFPIPLYLPPRTAFGDNPHPRLIQVARSAPGGNQAMLCSRGSSVFVPGAAQGRSPVSSCCSSVPVCRSRVRSILLWGET
jgi:hypothetical protein